MNASPGAIEAPPLEDAQSRGRLWLEVVGVFLLSAGISLGRLWLGNSAALGETLWAEDGLFPLCIEKAGFLTCLIDPFAGYFLFLPRALAWPISVMPVEMWALTANALAAALVGVLSAFAYVIARRANLATFTTVAIALLPTITPFVGLEALNAIGSSYMPLLFVATLAVGLVPAQPWGSWGVVGIAALLLVTALTIPSAVVLALVLVVQFARRVVSGRNLVVWLVALGLGLMAQAITATSASSPRPIALTMDSLNSWADTVPVSILTFWPGLSLGEYGFFINFTFAPASFTGWLVVGVLTALGVWSLTKGWHDERGRYAPVGILILSGLAFGFIPSVIGDANNRYFVVPLLLWGAGLLVVLDSPIRRARWWVLALISALVLAVWWPAIPASEYRSTPAPTWTSDVARMKAKCLQDPAFIDRPLFSPFWPPNWGDGLDEPTHPNLPCRVVLGWIAEG